jgi:calmodulin
MMAPNMMNPMQSNMMAPNMMNPMQSNMMNYLLNDIVLLFQRDVLNFTNQNFMGSL